MTEGATNNTAYFYQPVLEDNSKPKININNKNKGRIMREFIILTDSCSDLELNDRQKYGIEYVKMHFSSNGKEYVADLDWSDISFKDFYD